jgi:hypothetical protein
MHGKGVLISNDGTENIGDFQNDKLSGYGYQINSIGESNFSFQKSIHLGYEGFWIKGL